MKPSASSIRKSCQPAVLAPTGPTAAFSMRSLPEPILKDAYAGESNHDVLSLAQGLVDEGSIKSLLTFAQQYPDLYQSMKSRGISCLLRLFDDMPSPEASPLPKRLPLGDFTMASSRNIELKGMEIEPEQMYRLICYICFNLGTKKAALGGTHSDDTTLKHRMRQKLNGDRKATELFESCWQRMRSSGAMVPAKKNGGYLSCSLTTRPLEVRDEGVRAALQQALAEHRQLFTGC